MKDGFMALLQFLGALPIHYRNLVNRATKFTFRNQSVFLPEHTHTSVLHPTAALYSRTDQGVSNVNIYTVHRHAG